MNDESEKPPDFDTSYHVRRAHDGRPEHLEWIVRRFSPELLKKAEHDLGPLLRRVYDPADVVQYVWMQALEVLPEIHPRDGRFTPPFRSFLGKVLRNHVNKLLRDEVKKMHGAPEGRSVLGDPLDRLPAETATIVSRVVEDARRSSVYDALDSLDDIDQRILLLRFMDQLGNAEAASTLGIKPEAAATRYHRAKKRLREQLRGTEAEDLFDE